MPTPDRAPEPGLAEKVLLLDSALSDGKFAHAFGGALALAYYAEPRVTVDIDINVFVDPARYGDVLELCVGIGAERASAPSPAEIAERGQGRLRWGRNPLDLFFSYDPIHEAMERGIREVPFGDARIPILAPEHLLVAKAAFDRPKDWIDIEQMLIGVADLDLAEVRRWMEHVVGAGDSRSERLEDVVQRLRSDS